MSALVLSQLPLHPTLQRTVSALGRSTPITVQQAVIPLLLAGQDVKAEAPTGTRKAAAFLVPMLHRLASEAGTGARRSKRQLVALSGGEDAAELAPGLLLDPGDLLVSSLGIVMEQRQPLDPGHARDADGVVPAGVAPAAVHGLVLLAGVLGVMDQ